MHTLLQQLENNEAVLLMYAADELPAEDCAEVEHMLAIDAGMRAELESIRQNQSNVSLAIDKLDAITRLPMSQAVALRRLSPSLAAFHAGRLAPSPVPVHHAVLRYPWWLYPTASAAALLVAAVVWWGVRGDDSGILSHNNDGSNSVNSLADGSDAGGHHGWRHGSLFMMDDPDPEMADAEQQATTLSHRPDPGDITASIFMTDSNAAPG